MWTALLICGAQAQARDASSAIDSLSASSGWHAVFDGVDAKGWGGRGAAWSVKNGGLVPPAGQNEPLWFGKKLGDFEVEIAWKDTWRGDADVQRMLVVTRGGSCTILRDGARETPSALSDPNSGGNTAAELAGQFLYTQPLVVRGTPTGPQQVGAPWHLGLLSSPIETRSIRIRERKAMPGSEVELFDGKTISGWKLCGDASYTADDNSILGQVTKGAHSFLVTERQFGDFVFDVDVKNEAPGNSGIQIRSHQDASGKVFGYQIEIDPSKRAWSGGLYDEGRRAWLEDLSKNELARSAFTGGDWNHYHVECLGPWIRAWVNGIPTADWFDPLDLSGFIGLQVHSGNDTRVRWKDFRMRDLGIRSWEPVASDELFGKRDANSPRIRRGKALGDFGLRVAVKPLDGGRLHFRKSSDSIRSPGPMQIVGPALYRTSAGWFVELGDESIAGDDPKKERTIAIQAYGSRVALFVDGKSLVQVDAPDAQLAGRFELEGRSDEGPSIGDCALIGEPKR